MEHWKSRNSKIFRNEVTNPIITLLKAKRASVEWRIRNKLTQTIQSYNHPTSIIQP